MEIPTGGPATIVRVVAREIAPIVAVICTDAGVVVMGAWYRMERPSGVSDKMVPVPVVVHVTTPSGFALLYASRTVATITELESTARLVDVRRISTLAGVAGAVVTSCLPVIPLAYIAITEPAPTVVDAVNAPLEVIAPLRPGPLQKNGPFPIQLPNRSAAPAPNVARRPPGMSTGPSKRLPPTSMTTRIRSSGPGVTTTLTTRGIPPEETVRFPDPAR